MNAIQIIKKAAVEAVEAAQPVKVLIGKVESVQPLKIRINQKLVLDEDSLLLTQNVSNFFVNIAFSPSFPTSLEEGARGASYENYFKHAHEIFGNHRIIFQNALKIDERVLLLKMQEGLKFIVLDRLQGNNAEDKDGINTTFDNEPEAPTNNLKTHIVNSDADEWWRH